MNVFIIAQYLGDIQNPHLDNSRFLEVADRLTERGHRVRIVTTNFLHGKKKHVEGVTRYHECDVTTISEPGYPRNVCLTRFRSHHVLSKNLKKWLKTVEKPDVIYCAVPSLDFAYEAARYAKKNHIRFVLDVQDLWPEAFEMIIRVPLLPKLAFTPLRLRANAVYRSADAVLAVSDTYVERALKVNKKQTLAKSVFLGTDLSAFDSHRENTVALSKEQDEIWLGYVGTLGHSYDLKTVFDAMDQLRDRPYFSRLRFIVAGDGPLRSDFEAYAVSKQVPVQFTGRLPYAEMVATLCRCDVAINPIKKKSAGSIINKHGDYAAAGIPVINTQESPEYRRLVEKYDMGINCACENAHDVATAIDRLVGSEALRHSMGLGARRCAEELFDRRATYAEIVSAIER